MQEQLQQHMQHDLAAGYGGSQDLPEAFAGMAGLPMPNPFSPLPWAHLPGDYSKAVEAATEKTTADQAAEVEALMVAEVWGMPMPGLPEAAAPLEGDAPGSLLSWCPCAIAAASAGASAWSSVVKAQRRAFGTIHV